jgi:hypothetical protein
VGAVALGPAGGVQGNAALLGFMMEAAAPLCRMRR